MCCLVFSLLWGLLFACARAILVVVGLGWGCCCGLFCSCSCCCCCCLSRGFFSRLGRVCGSALGSVVFRLGVRVFLWLVRCGCCLRPPCCCCFLWSRFVLRRPACWPSLSGFRSLSSPPVFGGCVASPVCALRSVSCSVSWFFLLCCCCCFCFGFGAFVRSFRLVAWRALGWFFRLSLPVPCCRLCVAFGFVCRLCVAFFVPGLGWLRSWRGCSCSCRLSRLSLPVGFLCFFAPVCCCWSGWRSCLAFCGLRSLCCCWPPWFVGGFALRCLSGWCAPRPLVSWLWFWVVGFGGLGCGSGSSCGCLVAFRCFPAGVAWFLLVPCGRGLVVVRSVPPSSSPVVFVLVLRLRPLFLWQFIESLMLGV